LLGAVAFDLDDTLLRDDLSISDRTVAVMRHLRRCGVHILPASGRALESMRPFVERLDCASLVVACNGAEIYSPSLELIYGARMDEATALEVTAFGRENGMYMQTYEGDFFYYNEQSRWADSYARASMLRGRLVEDLDAFLIRHPTSKILMMGPEETITRMREEGQERFRSRLSVTTSKPYFLEFNPVEATKGNAMDICSDILHFSMDQLVAYGDSLNDVSMLLRAGTGVAVANRREDVKKQVSRIAPGNQEDGVARDLMEHYPEFFQGVVL
jgi:Cof subfamily protein (haloacid dehalogenase superfamily)